MRLAREVRVSSSFAPSATKTDSHADDIIQIVREEFGEGNEFCKKMLSGILADHILMEKGKGTFVRCGRQANDKCVKISQHLTDTG